ncbi:MAG: dihydroorotate dehydrogenase electron transfer subunit [Candidatus Latescibacteria bacterium]|nr:dihydroorotate dehydrogenase electron transfer subunit [Candidatus Latescibacterota bacterium]
MLDERAPICFNRQVAEGFYRLRLEAPRIATQAEPGQFASLRVSDQLVPLLRIPLSFCAVDKQAGTIDLLYETRGPKSRLLSQAQPQQTLSCLGPLGRGFVPPAPGQRVVLVGGGIGLPPLLFMGARLRQQGHEEVVLLAGARSAAKHLPSGELQAAAPQVRLATDDGSLGHGGLVTELLAEELEAGSGSMVCACGPQGMMAAAAGLCRRREVSCQVSLEEYMACGFGVCVGCVVETASGEGYGRYQRICVEGPVFDALQVRWEEG